MRFKVGDLIKTKFSVVIANLNNSKDSDDSEHADKNSLFVVTENKSKENNESLDDFEASFVLYSVFTGSFSKWNIEDLEDNFKHV